MSGEFGERDRRRVARHVLVWGPAGAWAGALLVGLQRAVELAARHRRAGVCDAQDAALLAWQTLRASTPAAAGAALAGPLLAALAFRAGGERRGRRWLALSGGVLLFGALHGEALARGAPSFGSELALDDGAVLAVLALGLATALVALVGACARVRGPLEDAPLGLRPLLGGGALASSLLGIAATLALPPVLVAPPARGVSLPDGAYGTASDGPRAAAPARGTPLELVGRFDSQDEPLAAPAGRRP